MTTPTITPPARTHYNRQRFLLVTAAVIAIDLASKVIAVASLDEPIDLGVVTLRVSHNSGIAFGVGNQLPTTIVIGLTVLITAALIGSALGGHLGTGLGPALTAGGATANVIDRLNNASVVDIIDLGWWPTFNLADTAICIGVALIILHHRHHQPEHPTPT